MSFEPRCTLPETGKDINEYHLTTGHDISSATYAHRYYVGGHETYPMEMTFNTDGSKCHWLVARLCQ